MMDETKKLDLELEDVSGGNDGGALYHHVVKGDTLGKIAQKYGTTVKKIVALNPRITNPDLIYAGEVIRVR